MHERGWSNSNCYASCVLRNLGCPKDREGTMGCSPHALERDSDSRRLYYRSCGEPCSPIRQRSENRCAKYWPSIPPAFKSGSEGICLNHKPVSTGKSASLIQHFPQLVRQGGWGVWFLQERHAFVQHALVNAGILGIGGGEKNPGVRDAIIARGRPIPCRSCAA